MLFYFKIIALLANIIVMSTYAFNGHRIYKGDLDDFAYSYPDVVYIRNFYSFNDDDLSIHSIYSNDSQVMELGNFEFQLFYRIYNRYVLIKY